MSVVEDVLMKGEENGHGDVKKAKRKKPSKPVKKRHKCQQCDKHFITPTRVRRHEQTHYNKCAECDATFSSYIELRKHWSTHRPPHACPHCEYKSPQLALVHKHFKVNHVQGVPCPVPGCTMQFAFSRIRRHISNAHGLKTKTPKSTVTADNQQQQQEETAVLTCDTCTTFTTSSHVELAMHVERAHGRGMPCALCGEMVNLTDLVVHLDSAHPNSYRLPDHRETVVEPEADSQTEASTVTRTTREAGEEGEATPSVCSVDRGSELEDIDMTEDEELGRTPNWMEDSLRAPLTRPPSSHISGIGGSFPCTMCPKTFPTRRGMTKHVASVHHKSYKPYERSKKYACDMPGCTKAFKTPGLLDDHKNLHIGARPYSCQSCARSYHARAAYALHLTKYHLMSIKHVEVAGPDRIAEPEPELDEELVSEDEPDPERGLSEEPVAEDDTESEPELDEELVSEDEPEPVQELRKELLPEDEPEPEQELRKELLPEDEPEPEQELRKELLPEDDPEPLQEPANKPGPMDESEKELVATPTFETKLKLEFKKELEGVSPKWTPKTSRAK